MWTRIHLSETIRPRLAGTTWSRSGLVGHNLTGSGAFGLIEGDQRFDGVVGVEAEVGIGVLVGPRIFELQAPVRRPEPMSLDISKVLDQAPERGAAANR